MIEIKDSILTVVVITYGHEEYISTCLESILNQKTNFRFTLLISNDNSPDNSDVIINNIIVNNINKNVTIKYYNHTENKGMTGNFIWALSKAKSKYIAFCEGDDSWIDEYKLQQQINILEKDNSLSLCCSGYKKSNNIVENLYKDKQNFEFTLEDHFNKWTVKMLTICYRNDNNLINFLKQFKQARDIHLIYYLLSKGNGYYINKLLGFYNIHEGGAVSLKSKNELLNISYNVFEEFYLYEKTEVIRKKKLSYQLLMLKYKMNSVSVFDLFKSMKVSDLLLVFKLLIKG